MIMHFEAEKYIVETTLVLAGGSYECTRKLIPCWYELPKLKAGELAGTLHLQHVRCGKKNCKCASGRRQDAHQAWYRLWRDEHGTQHKTYVKRFELGAIRQAIDRRQARVRHEQAERRAHMKSGRITMAGTAQDLEKLLGSIGLDREKLADLLSQMKTGHR